MPYKPGSFEEVTWDEVRLEVKSLAPDIFEAVEKISPDSNYKLYVAEYAYGAEVMSKQGILNIQVDDKLIPITSTDLPKKITTQLGYHHLGMPLGLVLDGVLQLSSIKQGGITYPENMFPKGELFAKQAAIDFPYEYQMKYYWSMHSGARTVYMLTSIANREKYKRLKNSYNLSDDVPLSQLDHWGLFQSIANSNQFPINWRTRCLYFGKEWVKNLIHHPSLFIVVAKRVHNFTIVARNSTFNAIWEEFSLSVRNKKVDYYILNMAAHIVRAALGVAISFKIAPSNNSYGPYKEIVEAILEVYGLKKYTPIIMVPFSYNSNLDHFAYVSAQMPTVDYKRVYSNKNRFLMADFREIKNILTKFLKNINPKILKQVSDYNFLSYLYNFYSADIRQQVSNKEFESAKEIFSEDKEYNNWIRIGNEEIDTKNPFLRACVRISRNQNSS